MNAVPFKKTQFDGRMIPSVSFIVVSDIDSTMMGGLSASSRILRKLRAEANSAKVCDIKTILSLLVIDAFASSY